jgi:hypothetical protein
MRAHSKVLIGLLLAADCFYLPGTIIIYSMTGAISP